MTRRRTFFPVLVLVALVTGAPADDPLLAQSEMEAVVPPTARLTGRVLEKDGVTPVRTASVELTSVVFGTVHTERVAGRGEFELDLPVGRYTLRIIRRHEIYESPSVYRIPSSGKVQVNFLLLRDFEETDAASAGDEEEGKDLGSAPSAGSMADRLPDPAREAVVVGSVVDLVQGETKPSRRWGEILGFIGSLLIVAVAIL